ncbi:MAG: hypothetical protein H6733_10125 [Alphaproteobacteria bacterium]|nr:hypothetical protein [Alphaproteobacteria bacterium]
MMKYYDFYAACVKNQADKRELEQQHRRRLGALLLGVHNSLLSKLSLRLDDGDGKLRYEVDGVASPPPFPLDLQPPGLSFSEVADALDLVGPKREGGLKWLLVVEDRSGNHVETLYASAKVVRTTTNDFEVHTEERPFAADSESNSELADHIISAWERQVKMAKPS